jgi:hypothetical protein
MNERPYACERWCVSWGYEDCTCELDERQARWDRENRRPGAAALPRAVIYQLKRSA